MATSALTGKQRVYDLIKTALTDCQVTYGIEKNPQKRWVYVGDVTYQDSEWAAIGAKRRSETYDVSVVVDVIKSAGKPVDAEADALAIVDAIETALRADPTLGGLTALGVALRPQTVKAQPITDGSECEWRGVVRISGVRI